MTTPPPPTLEEAYRLYHKRVIMLCTRFTRSVDDAEDLAQDVFLRVARYLPSFRGDCAFTTWLHRVTVNTALDKLRGPARKWERELASLEMLAEDPDQMATLQRALTSRDAPLESVVERLAASRAVASLSPGTRTVLELRMQGLSHKEITAVVGCSVPAARNSVSRAIRKLKGYV